MSSVADNFTEAAQMARDLAAECLREAETADAATSSYLISEHDRHLERADDYERRASWYAPKTKLEIAA